MSGQQKAQKIENEHADQQIQVSGSEISSNSGDNQDYQPKDAMKQSNFGRAFDQDNKAAPIKGAYDPSQYASLPVSAQVKELFKSIQKYSPIQIDLDVKIKAFVPDYIPAVGEVDAFLKMPRPDAQAEILGLETLVKFILTKDEPSLNQSDKAKIDLMMKNTTKSYSGAKNTKIHCIQDAQKNPKQILQWINSVGDIQKDKQPPSVSYSKPMPDIDSLMQVWPAQVQQMLSDINIPSQQIDLSLEDYCKVACNILDIPVYKDGSNNIVESLHVMFTLYSAFKQNQHFQVGDNEMHS